jgi:low affinity Fe/Cu permease
MPGAGRAERGPPAGVLCMQIRGRTMANKRSSNRNGIKRVPVPEQDWFSWFAQETARLAGRPVTFISAVALVVGWAALGPMFDFNSSWQLFINTATTILTFLMVFLIQNTQNRDTIAIQVKLAELVLHMPGVPDKLADAENLSIKQLERIHDQYKANVHERARQARRKRRR